MTNCKLSQKKIFGPQLSEEEVLDMIQAAPGLYSRYTSLSEQLKDEFLGFCMGTRGLNLTYDPMFKAVFDPQQFPSRLGEFLSLCLGEPVQILKALPTESSCLTEESSLLEMDLVQEYLMIPLDIFLKSQQNISSKLEAWLTLIASDDMKRIREVLQAYPEFGEIYYQVFQFRRNIEELMDMYSEALKILDSNTVKYMIERAHIKE